ncbi:MAG: hypothetical protein ACRDHP_12415 [Ktedonobacterales bacterium]
MGEDVIYDAYVEVRPDGTCLAQLLDLPGCVGRGADEASALTALAAGIPDYYSWLRRHDDYTPDVRGPFQVALMQAERERVVNGRMVGAFFAPEAEPTTSEDLDWLLALLDWAYSDLCALLAVRPDTAARDALATETAQEQVWLVSRIEPQPNVPRVEQLPGVPLDTLRQVWQASVHRLRETSEEERGRVVEHDGERWSLRKVLRRSIQLARMRAEAADVR